MRLIDVDALIDDFESQHSVQCLNTIEDTINRQPIIALRADDFLAQEILDKIMSEFHGIKDKNQLEYRNRLLELREKILKVMKRKK